LSVQGGRKRRRSGRFRVAGLLAALALALALLAGPGTGTASAANLLSNGSFENTGSGWLSPWYLGVKSGGAGTVSQTSGTKVDRSYSALLNVTTASSSAPWVVQLSQDAALTSSQTYTVSFAAKASAARTIDVAAQKTASPYSIYGERLLNLTTSWQTFTFSFQGPGAPTASSLRFNVGGATGSVWLDNVSLVAGTPSGDNAFTPVEDSYVSAASPSTNYGTSTALSSDGDPVMASYMKFDLSTLAGRWITKATLQMKVTNATNSTQSVRLASSSWSDSTINYNNRPVLGQAFQTFTAPSSGSTVNADVTSALAAKAGQLVTLGIDSAGSDGYAFYSRENPTDRVTLVVQSRPIVKKGTAMRAFASFWDTNTAGMDSDFADMNAANVKMARLDLSYSTTPIAAFDAAVESARSHGIKVLALVHKPPPTNDLGTDTDRTAFKSWLAQMVNRYKYYVKYWEILNEPNLHYEWNIDDSAGSDQTKYADSVRRYVEVLKDGYQTVKANDPNATVLFGGLSEWTVERYMDVLVTTDAYRYFDIMSFHPYGYNPTRVLSRFASFKAKMNLKPTYAVKPIWVTETGFNTSWTDKAGYVTSEQQKADYLAQTMHLLYGAGAQLPIFWYTLHENSDTTGFGLELKDPGTLATQYFPAYYTYRDLVF
jgi:hypothetical protein